MHVHLLSGHDIVASGSYKESSFIGEKGDRGPPGTTVRIGV